MTVRMLALKRHRYGGKTVGQGDEFIAKGGRDARLLSALGRAVAVRTEAPALLEMTPPPPPAPRARRQAAPFLLESSSPPPVPDAAVEPEPPRRSYRRRDLTAEDPNKDA